MKKNVLFLALAMLMPFLIKAQITVTQADFASVGDAVTVATDTLPLPAIGPGSAGANQTWNFTTLHNHYSNTLNFVNPSTTPFASTFTSVANLAFSYPGPFYNYMNSSASSVQLWGFGGDVLGNGTQHPVKYSNPEKLIPFPASYNTAYTDTSKYDQKYYYGQYINYGGTNYFIDSVRQKEINYITGTFDAWGTATTSNGTFPVLRSNIVKQTIDSTWARVQLYGIWIGVGSSSSTTQSYAFVSNGIDYFLVNMTYYPDSTVIHTVDWNMATPVSITENSNPESINVYPNPATDNVYVNNQSQKAYAIIYDIAGREMYKTAVAEGLTSIPVGNLVEGVYILKIIGDSGVLRTEKLIIK